jgi:hypothetical protein
LSKAKKLAAQLVLGKDPESIIPDPLHFSSMNIIFSRRVERLENKTNLCYYFKSYFDNTSFTAAMKAFITSINLINFLQTDFFNPPLRLSQRFKMVYTIVCVICLPLLVKAKMYLIETKSESQPKIRYKE